MENYLQKLLTLNFADVCNYLHLIKFIIFSNIQNIINGVIFNRMIRLKQWNPLQLPCNFVL